MSEPLEIIAGTPDKPLIIPGTDIVVEVYVLEGGKRVLSQTGFASALGIHRKNLYVSNVRAETPQFLATTRMKPFMSNDLMLALKSPIIFKNPRGGGIAYGYISRVLPWVCNAIMDANRAGVLTSRQANLVAQCEVLLGGLAQIGIDGLIDEITGYQDIRAKNALAKILESYIADQWKPWTRTFPIEFGTSSCGLDK